MTGALAPAAERRGKGWLTLGTVVNGITSYLFITVGEAALGAAGYAPVAAVWTAWTLLAAAVTVPVQHLVVVRRAGGWRFVASEVAAPLVGLAVVLAGALTLVGQRVFSDDSLIHPVAVGIILLGAFALGISRGRLAASGDFRGLGASLATEGIVRLIVLVPVLLLGGGADWVVLTLLTGLAALVVRAAPPGTMPSRGIRADLVSALQFGSGNAMGVTVLAGGPLLLGLLLGVTGAPITAFFATVALLRAPYLLLTGVSPRISDALLRARRTGAAVVAPWVVAAAVLVATTVLGAAAVVIGPWLIELLFGDDATVGGPVTGVLAAAHVLALATLVLALVPVTVDRPQAVSRAWGPAMVLWLVLTVALPLEPVAAVAWATLAAEVLVAGLLLVELARWSEDLPRRPLRPRRAR